MLSSSNLIQWSDIFFFLQKWIEHNSAIENTTQFSIECKKSNVI